MSGFTFSVSSFPRLLRRLLLLVGLAACTACEMPDEVSYEGAFLATSGSMTRQNRELRDVPLPDRKVTVAVYGLPDLTGQYKESNSGQTLSRSVTQGGAAVLIKALQDAGERGWFSVLDRSNLENVLRERQIITEMRRVYRGETTAAPSVLGPLQHAGILIEGAVIGYDSNTMTGGYGARYLGIGGHKKWKLDVVTVNLRAVSTETSEVLASVVVRKPVGSVSTNGLVFTYIELDKLLEAEGGTTTNEPKQVAIEQAVEKAVMALIAEGAVAGLWRFSNKRAGQDFLEDYLHQKFDGNVSTRAQNDLAGARPADTHIPATVPLRPRVRATPAKTSQQQQKPASRLPPDGPRPGEILG